MYKETIRTPENCPDYNNYTCNLCEKTIFGGDPMVSNEATDTHICTGCLLDGAEFVVKLNLGGLHLYWLKELEYKYFKCKRKKRNNNIPKKIRNDVLKKYKFQCLKCGSKERLEIDHIKPVSKGGNDEFRNLQVLCKTCNLKKGTKHG
jgi:hypothetical protein